jgi:hypothetical protein
MERRHNYNQNNDPHDGGDYWSDEVLPSFFPNRNEWRKFRATMRAELRGYKHWLCAERTGSAGGVSELSLRGLSRWQTEDD